jgi:hypothetical protein
LVAERGRAEEKAAGTASIGEGEAVFESYDCIRKGLRWWEVGWGGYREKTTCTIFNLFWL